MELVPRLGQEAKLEEAAAQAVAETSAFITECLRHPEFAVRIPTILAGSARFPSSLSDAFWAPVLSGR
jgi:hypothetical protein